MLSTVLVLTCYLSIGCCDYNYLLKSVLLQFLEQQSFPNPVKTGVVLWDDCNLKIKVLLEDVSAQRRRIHAKSSMTPKPKDTSAKVASMWKACDVTLGLARDIRHSLRQKGLIPYPEPLWFNSRYCFANQIDFFMYHS
jgi:hypothetical protein